MPNLQPLSAELALKAARELNEDPEQIDDYFRILREWIKQQPHLKACTDDEFLILFLRGCKYSLEKCKVKLDLYYSVRNILPELFLNRNPYDELSQKILRLGVQIRLPNTEFPDSPRILLFSGALCDPNAFHLHDVLKVGMMLNDALVAIDYNLQVAGHIFILDMKNVTMSHMAQCSPAFIKKAIFMIQNASPFRFKQFHYINASPAFETLFNICKGFLSEKIKNQTFVHGDNLDSLFQHVPQRLFPKEYGGDAGSIQGIADEMRNKFLLMANDKICTNDLLYGVDESKRIGKSKISENLFGLDGSFRKLNVD